MVEDGLWDDLAEFSSAVEVPKREIELQDLALASLDVVEIGLRIEKRWGVELRAEELDEVHTLGDLSEMILGRLSTRPAASRGSVAHRVGEAGRRAILTTAMAARTKAYLAPSVLSADHAHLAEQVALVEEHAGALHIDFMDGHFVPTLGFAPAVIGALKSATTLPLRCHLMVEEPDRLVQILSDEGADLAIFHAECGARTRAALQHARELGMKTGLALKLDTPVTAIETLLDELDSVLVMSIVPGWSGQAFHEEALHRIADVRATIDRRGLEVEVEVDGGVNEETGRSCVMAGATVLAAATAVFQATDPAEAAHRMTMIIAGE
jgi:ribulose-phosphate 3-epimerase